MLVEAGENHDFTLVNLVDEAVGELVEESAARFPQNRSKLIRIPTEIGCYFGKFIEELAAKSPPTFFIPLR